MFLKLCGRRRHKKRKFLSVISNFTLFLMFKYVDLRGGRERFSVPKQTAVKPTSSKETWHIISTHHEEQ